MTAAALLVALCAVSPARAQWSVKAATSAVIGMETTVSYSAPADAPADLAPLPENTTSFLVVSVKESAPRVWDWTLLPVETGRVEFRARWRSTAGELVAPALALTVADSDLPLDSEIADIHGPWRARPALWPWLLVLFLAEVLRRAHARWRGRALPAGPGTPALPPKPAHEAAEERLTELERSGLWEEGHHEDFYLGLTTILREYLEARYGEPATAMTSSETARLLRERHGDLGAAARAREALERADLVKFARAKPAPQDGPADLRLAREIVRATAPRTAAEEARA